MTVQDIDLKRYAMQQQELFPPLVVKCTSCGGSGWFPGPCECPYCVDGENLTEFGKEVIRTLQLHAPIRVKATYGYSK